MESKKLRYSLLLTILSLALVAFLIPTVTAQPTRYFPGTNINYTGGSNSFPLNSTSSNKCQFLYKTTDFNSVPSGAFMITTVYIKPSSTRNNQSISNLTIKLKNTSLTTLTSGTWNSGLTTVYNPSSVTISTTANQWKAITLSTPFLYTGGNLLVEISQTNSSSPGISLNHYTVSGRNGRMYGGVNSSSSSGASSSTALFGFDGVPAACSGTPQAPVITTSAMSAASPICAGSTKSLSASDPNAPITSITYQWQSGSSATGPFSNVSGGTGSSSLNYTTAPLSATTWFRMGAKCTNSNITTYSAAYRVSVGAQQPGAISGRPVSCPGDTATYSVPAAVGNTYAWTLPSGWTGSSTTNSIFVTMGNAGTLSVIANGCGGPSVAQTKTIVTGTAPAAPASVSGAGNVCAGTAQVYSVAPVVGAGSYTWTLPGGWTGSSTTNTISVTSGNSGGSVTVKANNGCGSSATTTKAVSIITTLQSPGTITSSAVGGTYCGGALYTFNVNPVPGATAYSWLLPSGWSGVPSGNSLQAYAGTTGQVKVTASVSCATSTTSSLSTTVTPSVTPSVSIAPNSAVLCQGRAITFTATPANGGSNPQYQWMRNGINVIGTGNSFISTSIVNGDVIAVKLTSNAVCRNTDTVSKAHTASVIPSVIPGISINTNPVTKICAGTRLSFNTTRMGGGTAPAYQWYINGMAVAGATDTSFSSITLADKDTITVRLTSSATCATMSEAGSNKVSVLVTDTVRPAVSIAASSVRAGEPISFTANYSGGGATPDFHWIRNGVEIPGETGETYITSGLEAGDHISVRMLSYAACAAPPLVMSDEIIIQSTTGLGQYKGWEGSVSLFPNPTMGRLTINAEYDAKHVGKLLQLDIYNMLGQRVYNSSIVPDRTKWRSEIRLAEALPAGQYTLRMSTADGMAVSVPFLLRR